MHAVWNGTVLAESDATVLVEGNHYFPPDSVRSEHCAKTRMHTLCFWKGVASYYTVTVDGRTNKNAAWFYRHPSPLARRIKDHVAFGSGISVEAQR